MTRPRVVGVLAAAKPTLTATNARPLAAPIRRSAPGAPHGGCHLNRPIDRLLVLGGFEVVEMQTGYIAGPRVGAFLYRGLARPTSSTPDPAPLAGIGAPHLT